MRWPLVALLLATTVTASGERPHATQAGPVASYGPSSGGMALRVSTRDSVVPSGAAIVFDFWIRRDGDASAATLNIVRRTWSLDLVFRDLESGREFERTEIWEVHVPPPTWMPVTLAAGAEYHDSTTVRLLSVSGELVPPGRYAVSARYTNDGGYSNRVVQVHGWQGTLHSGELTMEITPSPDEEISFLFPTEIRLWPEPEAGCFTWTWGESLSGASATLRPGYRLRTQWTITHLLDGAPFPKPWTTAPLDTAFYGFSTIQSGSYSIPDWTEHRFAVGTPALLEEASGERPLEVEAAVEVFGTAASPSMDPRMGAYHILWADTLRARWP